MDRNKIVEDGGYFILSYLADIVAPIHWARSGEKVCPHPNFSEYIRIRRLGKYSNPNEVKDG